MSVEVLLRRQAGDYQNWASSEASDETDAAIRLAVYRDGLSGERQIERAATRLAFRLVHIAWLARESGLDWQGFSPYELRHAADLDPSPSRIQALLRYGVEIARWPYGQYLRSPEWGDVRYFALRRAGKRCQLCNSPRCPQVHHRTYENRGNEDLADVVVLCADCHSNFHGIR